MGRRKGIWMSASTYSPSQNSPKSSEGVKASFPKVSLTLWAWASDGLRRRKASEEWLGVSVPLTSVDFRNIGGFNSQYTKYLEFYEAIPYGQPRWPCDPTSRYKRYKVREQIAINCAMSDATSTVGITYLHQHTNHYHYRRVEQRHGV